MNNDSCQYNSSDVSFFYLFLVSQKVYFKVYEILNR